VLASIIVTPIQVSLTTFRFRSSQNSLTSPSKIGLFGIAASVQPDFAQSIGNVIGYQLDSLTRPMRGGVTPTELSRAKNQLKSSLVMALESRSVEVEGEQAHI
jgi:hypothetical protein